MNPKTITMRTAKALELARSEDLGADVVKALEEAEALNYEVIDWRIDYGDGSDPALSIARHRGVMVSLTLPSWLAEQIAVPGGEAVADMHITVLYIGTIDDLTVQQQQQLIGIVADAAREFRPLDGVLQGLEAFEPSESSDGAAPIVLHVNIPGIHELRQALIRRLDDADIPHRAADFPTYIPHVTLAYVENAEEVDLAAVAVAPVHVTIGALTAAIGGAHYDAPFVSSGMYYGPESGTSDGWSESQSAYRPNFFKQLTIEKDAQFTIGAWYVPQFLDAHGDWMSTTDVEKAFHGYVDTGDRGIRLQHNPDIVAGRWVEAYIEREALTKMVPDPDTQELVKHEYPAGTPFLGVYWEDWAWPLVKSGEIRGFSIGGSSEVFEVDLGPDAAAAAAAAA